MNLKRLNILVEGPVDDVRIKRANLFPFLGQRFYVMAHTYAQYKEFVREIRCSEMVARFLSEPEQIQGIDGGTIVRLSGYHLHPNYVDLNQVMITRRGITMVDIT